jgi:pilus assembly protein CpaB
MARTLAQAGPERTNRLILMGAVGLAVLAAALAFAGLNAFGGGGGSGSLGPDVRVVVAAQDIAAGTKISGDMLTVSAVPRGLLIDGAIADPKLAAGLTALYPVAKNDQISAAKLGQTAKQLGFPGTIPDGKRAVSLPVSETTGVGGLIVAGDYVDITVVTGGAGGGNVKAATTLLQHVLVLSVAQNAAKPVARVDANGTPVPGAGTFTTDSTDPDAKAKSVTVAVDPKDVPLLALAQDEGTIYLSLRPPGDAAAVPGVNTPQTLPGQPAGQ